MALTTEVIQKTVPMNRCSELYTVLNKLVFASFIVMLHAYKNLLNFLIDFFPLDGHFFLTNSDREVSA